MIYGKFRLIMVLFCRVNKCDMNSIKKLLSWCLSRKAFPYWGILIFDSFTVLLAGVFCYTAFHGRSVMWHNIIPLTKTLCLYLLCYWVGFRLMRTYSGVLRYSSFVDLCRVGMATLIGVVLITLLKVFLHVDRWLLPIRWREILGTFFIATIFMCMLRILIKVVYDKSLLYGQAVKRTFIYGVRSGGIGIAKSIRDIGSRHYQLCGFVSTASDMVGKQLMGVRVYRNDDSLVEIMKEKHVKVLFVSPLCQKEFLGNKQLIDSLISAGISINFIDPVRYTDGKNDLNVTDFREVEIEDLLPRDEIQVDMNAIGKLLKGSVVLITGSGGSIGSEIVRQVAAFEPENMILVDEAETPQHDIRLMMAKNHPDVKFSAIVTSICRKNRMEHIFMTYKPDYVFHAAAYKHVPMMEDNPCEAVENNVEGTKIVADLSVKYGVKKFVMISTDKAVNPTNVMGCSKRICEIYVQSLDKAIKDGRVKGQTQFVTTRFGNVLGSNGSVIPLFKQQIKAGGPVTVTHPNIIRFFMLIPEACKLVLEAGTMGRGGEIFVFDMGKPVRIADMAKRMILLSGATNVEIKYTGLRDGEKLYEEVLDDEEITHPTENKKIKVATVRQYDFAEVSARIDDLISKSYEFDDMKTVAIMKAIVPEYKSKHSKYEALDA